MFGHCRPTEFVRMVRVSFITGIRLFRESWDGGWAE
jgi:hypothetical protein